MNELHQVTHTPKTFFDQPMVRKKFEELMGKRSTPFITTLLQVVNSNELLKKADHMSIMNAACVSATLDLPIDPNLGYACIVPFNDRKSGKCLAQLQVMVKGFVQLAKRSNTMKSIYVSEIYEGEILEANPLDGYTFDFSKRTENATIGKVIGYAARFKELSGFEATLYMTKEELEKHGKRFSQTYKNNFGLWKDDFPSMAKKTVVKQLLSKYATLSIDTQHAISRDQTVEVDGEVRYIDNDDAVVVEPKDHNLERCMKQLEQCNDIDTLNKIEEQYGSDVEESVFNKKRDEISGLQ